MSDLWKEFIDYLGSLQGIEKRDMRLLDLSLHAAAKDFSRRSHNHGATASCDSEPLAEHRSEAFHRYMVEASTAHITTMPHAVRAVRAELRNQVHALMYPPALAPTSTTLLPATTPSRAAGGRRSSVAASSGVGGSSESGSHLENSNAAIAAAVLGNRQNRRSSTSTPPPQQTTPLSDRETVLSPLLQLPEDDTLGVHISVSSLEVNIEPIVQAVGPYVRHPEGKRSLSGTGVLKQMSSLDLCNRYLQWSNQRLENVHSGIGSVLASVESVHRRRLVFLVSAEHAKAWSDAENHTDPNASRFSWKLLKESNGTSVIQREKSSSSSLGPLSASAWNLTSDATLGTGGGGNGGDDASRYISVKVTESDCLRVAAGMDHTLAMQLLSTVKANLIQWEKQCRAEFDRRVTRTLEQLQQHRLQQLQQQNVDVTEDLLTIEEHHKKAALAAATEQAPPAAHFMQVLLLIDVDNHHVGDQLTTTIHELLPRLRNARQTAKESRRHSPYKAVFDLFPQVVFFGQRLVQLVLPRISSSLLPSSAAIGDALAASSSSHGDDVTALQSLARRIAMVSDRVQRCAKEHGSQVAFAIPSDSLSPRALDQDICPQYSQSELVISFQRHRQHQAGPDAPTPVAPKKRDTSSTPEQKVDRKLLSLALQYPGGERAVTKHAVQLLFQLWCTQHQQSSTFQEPSSKSSSSSLPPPLRASLVLQQDAFVSALRTQVDRLCVLSIAASKTLSSSVLRKMLHSGAGTRRHREEPTAFESHHQHHHNHRESPEHHHSHRKEASTSSSQLATPLTLSYADILNVVMRASIEYQAQAASSPSVEIAAALVGQTTLLTLLASLYASFGVNTVVYDQNSGDEACQHPRGIHEGVLRVNTVLGFSLMQDVHDFGKQFVELGWYEPIVHQLNSLQNCFWPMLIELRSCAVSALRIASIASAAPAVALDRSTRSPGTASGGGVGSMSLSHSISTRSIDLQREVFVVSVGDDEDAETLERADKSGELGHALCMPVVRVFVIPTPYLLGASTAAGKRATSAAAAALRRRRSARQLNDSVSDDASSTATRNSSSVLKPPSSSTAATASQQQQLQDDSKFLHPHVYQMDDADALGRIASQFSAELERSRPIYEARATSDGERKFFSGLTVRICPAAVLHPNRLQSSSLVNDDDEGEGSLLGGGVGPLLPCVEIGIHYSSGPHPASVAAVAADELIRDVLARGGDIPNNFSAWVMSAARFTMDHNSDVATAKEEALVHAIRAAEKLLSGETPRLRHGGVLPVGISTKPKEKRGDDDDEADAFRDDHSSDTDNNEEDDGGSDNDANTGTTTVAADNTMSGSSWWWWGGSSNSAAASTPDVTGLRFNIQSARLEQKRSNNSLK